MEEPITNQVVIQRVIKNQVILIFSKALRTMIMYQNWFFEFLRIVIMNLKNCAVDCQRYVLRTAQHWREPSLDAYRKRGGGGSD
jgi:hypothetical protein